MNSSPGFFDQLDAEAKARARRRLIALRVGFVGAYVLLAMFVLAAGFAR